MSAVLEQRPAPETVQPSPWQGPLLRVHFSAGILVALFLLVAATTGLLFTLAPQIEEMAHGDALHVPADRARRLALPLYEQVQSAQLALPGGSISHARPAQIPRDTTQVSFAGAESDGGERTVFIEPCTKQSLGTLTTSYGQLPATAWLDELHQNLLLGSLGRNYSELAASWLWVLAISGAWVGWQRVRRTRRGLRAAGFLLPELGAGKVRRTSLSLLVFLALDLVLTHLRRCVVVA